MPPSTSTRTKLALVGLILMWLASIAHEPGGLGAFASEIQAVEQGIGEVSANLDQKLSAESNTTVIEYLSGVVCERDPQTQQITEGQCQAMTDPDTGD